MPSWASLSLSPRRESPRSMAVRERLFLLRTSDSAISSRSRTAVASFSFSRFHLAGKPLKPLPLDPES